LGANGIHAAEAYDEVEANYQVLQLGSIADATLLANP
jgi:hypothetical protein